MDRGPIIPYKEFRGTSGTQVKVIANAFRLDWNGGLQKVFQYLVTMRVVVGNGRPSHDDPTRGKAMEIMHRLQVNIAPQVFICKAGYDGKSILWSTGVLNLPGGQQEFHVPWSEQVKPNPTMVIVAIKYTREIEKGMLRNLLWGRGAKDADADSAINALNVIVQHAPTLQGIRGARSLFVESGDSKDVGPFRILRGYFQSVRPRPEGLMLNVDITRGLVIREVSLQNAALGFLSSINPKDLRLAKSHSNYQLLRQGLKGVRIKIDLPGYQGRSGYTIRDLVPKAGSILFDKDFLKISVADHIWNTYNVSIRDKEMVGIEVGSGAVFPMQVCSIVPNQLYKKPPPKKIQDQLVQVTRQGPRERLRMIQDAWVKLDYQGSPWLDQAGLNVSSNVMEVTARLLKPPSIQFGADEWLHNVNSWDIRGKAFVIPQPIMTWAILNFSTMNQSSVTSFGIEMRGVLNQHGMILSSEPKMLSSNPINAKTILHQGQSDLMIVILPKIAPELYRTVKRFGDIESGVVTQCVNEGKKLNNQYCNNLAMKINAKLGGTNSSATGLDWIRDEGVMVLGADVSRPGERSQPSIASLVASWDSDACQYAAQISLQAPRQEEITDLYNMMLDALKLYVKFHKKKGLFPLPRRLLFYRDGVSEGEYRRISAIEIKAIRGAVDTALQKLGLNEKDLPKLTFIVVGKRHHMRFFPHPDSNSAADNKGNCRYGLVVDSGVIQPSDFNFYLQSHSAIIGTSRPSHYIVIMDTNRLTADILKYNSPRLQKISYALCHVYARASRAVSRPAPVYYADLVCRRAKNHFDDQVNSSWDYGSDSGNNPKLFDLRYFQEHFRNVNAALQTKMYFL